MYLRSVFFSVPTAPTTPTLKELSNALDSVVNWFSLGVKLGLEDHELRTIEQNNRGDRCKLEMLSCWLRSGKPPTWKAIIDALQLMGEHTVAAKIQAKHCSSSTDTGTCLPCLLYFRAAKFCLLSIVC